MDMNMKNINLPEIDARVIVGREIIADGRTIWPVTRITVIKGFEDDVQAIEVSPFAMLITDPTGEYAESISGKPMAVKEILKLAPALREVLAKRGEAGKD